ncbi:restriction endonuclease subunit S [Methylomonas sp. LL1]|uniref:restriction endonuclease subunit S n=1 Tax=Methylomonas sp. LL1 TaxID=2785785 RepID=UPI0018C37FA5|nr:restriction endonuclease subunit S [Methylomonas sp. LL1]QPK62412.1 restriction endonuclease subunit S [Methylomonas sp. LL1]
MQAYKTKPLGELANDITVGFVGTMASEYVSNGIPFLRSLNIKPYRFESTDLKYITKEFHEKIKKSALKPGDVAVVRTGNPGASCVIPDSLAEANCSDLVVIRCGENLDPHFVSYYINSVTHSHVKSQLVGAIQKHFNIGSAKELAFPNLTKQRQSEIASILKILDAKIELNNRINAELEAMAKSLYDYWFVQFDFPFDFASCPERSRREGKPAANGKPYKSSGGKMVYNPILKREIPVEWTVKNLNNCVDTILDHRGKTPTKLAGEWCNDADGIIAISAKNIKNGKLVNLESANKVNHELFNKWMPDKLKEGDILMTSEAPAGEFYFILGETKYCMSQRIFAIRANLSVIFPSVLYFELSKGNGLSQILSSLSGSTVFGIRQDVLREIKVLVPEIYLQELFNSIVLPQLKKIEIIDQETKHLEQIRDWLLPMLMNGQVTVQSSTGG